MRQFKPGQLQTGSIYPISASYALTASYVSGSVSIDTGSLVTTASFNAYTGSQSLVSQSFDSRINSLTGSINTLTSSYNSFTSSYTTGSFTGSFTGDGSQLTGIVSSKWTGSNPISRESDVEISGSLRVSGSVNVTSQLTAHTLAVQSSGPFSATLISNALTSSNNYYFPNKQGTLALREDLPKSGSGLTQIIATPDTFKLGGNITENTIFTDDTNQYHFSLNGPNLYLYKADDNSAPTIRLNRASGSANTPLPPAAYNYLGVISAGGYDTGVLAASAALIFQASENFTSGSRGTDLFFNTTPNGTNVPIRRLTIKNDGTVIITGSLEVTGSISAVSGFTGSLFGTASWAENAVTASFITASNVVGTVTSASYALTASFAENGGNQNLQSVTDNGNTTTNALNTIDGIGNYGITAPNNLTTGNYTSNTIAYLNNDGTLGLGNGSADSLLKNTNVTNSNVILEFPNKSAGSYTISTTDDLTAYTTTSSFNSFTSSYNADSASFSLTKQNIPIVVSSSITAQNDRVYHVIANATFTDPTPVEGRGYVVFLANGTVTLGGQPNTHQSIYYRVYHSGSWLNFRYDNFTRLSNFFVPQTRTINGLDLTTNRTLTADLVGAVSTSSFNSFTSSIQGQVDSLTAATSSYLLTNNTSSMLAPYVLTSSTSSMTVLSSSFANTASFVTASNVYGPYGSNSVVSSSYATSSSFALTASYVAGASSFPFTGSALITGSLGVTGSVSITRNITSSRAFISSSNGTVSGSTLTVYGSGSTQPVFTVQGSQGELFSVTDSLSGSLFSVNDISGLPILEVFSDNTTLIGNYLDPMLITTTKITQTNSGSFTIYSLPTASYDTAFFEYSIKSGSNARAGTIMAIQAGSTVNFTETTTTDIGDTTAVSFTVLVTGSNIALTGSSTSGAWVTKCIIRGV